MEHKRMRNTEVEVVLRRQCLALSNGICRWSEHAADQRRIIRLAEMNRLRYKSLAIRPAMLRWRLCVSRRKGLARCEDKVECRMLRMKLWSPFAKLERVKLLSRDFDARICGCVIRWERVEASKASVSMRLFRRVFFAWHVHKTLGQQVKAKAFGSFVTCAMEAKRK